MNRLVLASLNQGARLVGVLERRCRNHLMQRTDVRAGAIWQDADFPDGPYGPHDYAEDLTEREAEEEVRPGHCGDCGCYFCLSARLLRNREPQEMPDELWPRPTFCGNVSHTVAGTFVCDLPADHDGAPYWGHESGGSMGWGAAAPETSAPVPRAVVAGASPGGATHPAPPGERELLEWLTARRDDERRFKAEASDAIPFNWHGGRASAFAVVLDYVAALYPMQPQEKP